MFTKENYVEKIENAYKLRTRTQQQRRLIETILIVKK